MYQHGFQKHWTMKQAAGRHMQNDTFTWSLKHTISYTA